jgi:hypothetical protein
VAIPATTSTLTLPGGWGSLMGAPYALPMGFNPHRVHRRSTSDYFMIGVPVLACVLMLAWAFFG